MHGPERIDRANARLNLAKGSPDTKDVHESGRWKVARTKAWQMPTSVQRMLLSAGPAMYRLFRRERWGGRY